ncbi:MAG: hypothetical protein WBD30_00925, partial [Bacteroidota bacterium]
MALISGRTNSVIGLFVDGLEVKLAHLKIRKKRVVVEELKSATLVTKLHEHKIFEESASGMGDVADAFSLNTTAPDPVADGGSDDNDAVLVSLLSQYPRNSYQLTY